MKKVSLVLFLLCFFTFASSAFADNERGKSKGWGRNTTFENNGFWDNWFVGFGAGANLYTGDHNNDARFFKRLTVVPSIEFGKWMSPYFGSRIKISGGSLHNFTQDATNMLHSRYLAGELDFMWNMSQYLWHYNEGHLYNLIPYVGAGFMGAGHYRMNGQTYMMKGGNEYGATLNAGIINKFRITKRISIDVDFSYALLREGMNRMDIHNYDNLCAASASLIFKVGKIYDFKEAKLWDQSVIDGLNAKINRLRVQNAELAKRPVSCPRCPEPPVAVTPKAPAPRPEFITGNILFQLKSDKIDSHQMINIDNAAQYLMDNPTAKIRIIGYADKKTGTAKTNCILSQHRAKNVADVLIKKYRINPNRIKVEWKGDTHQPFKKNAWNRVVMFLNDSE